MKTAALANRAFTIMEVLIVIMIISIMSSVIMPSYSGFQATEQAFAEAAKLVADFRMARYRAIEYQCYTRLRFSDLADGWFIEDLYDSGTNEPIVGEPTIAPSDFLWETVIGEEMRDLSPAITMTFAPDPPPILYFRPDGVLVASPTFNAPPIGVTEVTFVYSDNELADGAAVSLNPAGIVESRAYYREDY